MKTLLSELLNLSSASRGKRILPDTCEKRDIISHYYQKAVGLVLSSGEHLLSMEPKPDRSITEKIA